MGDMRTDLAAGLSEGHFAPFSPPVEIITVNPLHSCAWFIPRAISRYSGVRERGKNSESVRCRCKETSSLLLRVLSFRNLATWLVLLSCCCFTCTRSHPSPDDVNMALTILSCREGHALLSITELVTCVRCRSKPQETN